jgi:hypothetical protein
MNLNNLQRKLIAAARIHSPSETVPYAFEKRILHRIKDMEVVDHWASWARGLWRGAAPCVALALLLAICSVLLNSPATSSNTDVSQEFENTVLAAATLEQPPSDSLR